MKKLTILRYNYKIGYFKTQFYFLDDSIQTFLKLEWFSWNFLKSFYNRNTIKLLKLQKLQRNIIISVTKKSRGEKKHCEN